MVRIVSGDVTDSKFHDYVINVREKHQGNVLLCSSRATSDVVIEAQTAGGSDDIPLQNIEAHFHRLVPSGALRLILSVRTP